MSDRRHDHDHALAAQVHEDPALDRQQAAGDGAATQRKETAADRARELLTAKDRAQQLAALPPPDLAAIAHACHDDVMSGKKRPSGSNDFLSDLFLAIKDEDPETLVLVASMRFEKTFVWAGPGSFDGPTLRALWRVLVALPDSATTGNDMLSTIEVTPAGATGGNYSGYYFNRSNKGTVQLQVDTTHLGATYGGDKGAPLPVGVQGQNELDHSARHELGHAFDDDTWYSGHHASEEIWGGWRDYASNDEAMADIAKHAGIALASIVGSNGKQFASALVSSLQAAFKGSQSVIGGVASHLGSKPDEVASWTSSLSASPIMQTLERVFTHKEEITKPSNKNEPKGATNYGVEIDGRGISLSLANGKVYTYSWNARSNRVSDYAMFAPREYFAEAYAAYYDGPNGSVLAQANGALKTAMDGALKAKPETQNRNKPT